MAEIVVMPKLGFDMKEGTFAAWVKNVGEQINSGDVIAEVETDKATVEVETYISGTLLHVMAEAGEILEVGAPIAIVGSEGEEFEHLLGDSAAQAKAAQKAEAAQEDEAEAEAVAESAAAQTKAESAPAPTKKVAPSSNGGKSPVTPIGEGVKASPVARRIASEKGLNLHYVQGSGPGGRIIKRDVENLEAADLGQASSAAGSSVAGIGTSPSYEIMSNLKHEVIDTSRLRKAIARRMVESKQFVPHFMVTMAIQTDALLKLRKQINAQLDEDHKVTVNDLIVKATALSLRAFPNLNTHYHGEKLVRYEDINIGIAVALPEGGLINVVARNADSVALSVMAKKNKDMIAAAREGKVRPDDIEGSTFTVSNLGAFGVSHFTAIINPPEAGILAIGASQTTPIANEAGELAMANLMNITISVDHRVSDGAEGAEFLRYLKGLLEEPMRLLV